MQIADRPETPDTATTRLPTRLVQENLRRFCAPARKSRRPLGLGSESQSVHQPVELIEVVELDDQLTAPLLATFPDMHAGPEMLAELPTRCSTWVSRKSWTPF